MKLPLSYLTEIASQARCKSLCSSGRVLQKSWSSGGSSIVVRKRFEIENDPFGFELLKSEASTTSFVSWASLSKAKSQT